MKNSTQANPRNAIESMMFSARWLQLPMYLGLIVALGVYSYEFFLQLWELIELILVKRTPDKYVILEALDLIDIVMVANLLIMVIVGGYESFVSRLNLDEHRQCWITQNQACDLDGHHRCCSFAGNICRCRTY